MSEMGGGSEIEERKGGREKDRGERRGKKKIPVYLFQCGPNRDGQRIERERLFMCASIPVQTRRSERGREREKERERERDGRKAKTINKIAGSEGARARIRRVASVLLARDHETRV